MIKSLFGAKFFESFTTNGDLGLAGSRMVTSADGQGQGGDVATRVQALPAPTETLKEVFLDIRESLRSVANNTEETVKILRTAVLGPPDPSKDDRDESISAGETDPKREKGPGVLSRVGGALQKVNPFSEEFGFGNIGRLIMFGAGLLALNLFGNKLIDPLAGLLKTIKTGSIGTTITDTYNAIKEELEPAFENIKTGIKNFIENTQFILSLIMNIGKTVSDFIAKYDVRGTEGPAGQQLPDGMLDEGERKAMIEDLTKGLTEAITKFTDNIIRNLILGFSIYTIGSMALRSLMGAAATGTAFATVGGIFSVAAASIIIAAGIFKLADNVMTAYEDAVTDEFGKPQKFNFKEFFTRLIVGKDTGSTIGNVLQNSFDKALIGGAIGTAIAPGIGTAVGALAGLVIGGFSAYMGDEKVGQMIEDGFGETSILGQTIDLLYNTYELLILKPFEFIFGKLGVANDSLFTKLGFFGIEPGKERKIYTDEELYGENVNPDKLAMKSTNELLQIKKDNEAQKLNLEKTKPITIMGRDFFPFGEFLDTRDSRKVLATLDAVDDELEQRGINTDTLEFSPGGADISNSQFVFDTEMMQKYKALGMSFVPNPQGGGFLMVDNKNAKSNSDNTSMAQYSLGGLTTSNSDAETRALVESRF